MSRLLHQNINHSSSVVVVVILLVTYLPTNLLTDRPSNQKDANSFRPKYELRPECGAQRRQKKRRKSKKFVARLKLAQCAGSGCGLLGPCAEAEADNGKIGKPTWDVQAEFKRSWPLRKKVSPGHPGCCKSAMERCNLG